MIRVENVFKKYSKEVLHDISFNLDEGEILSIGGKNGSGKSTLLKIITNIIKADKGNIFIDDKDISKNPNVIKEKIGYVSQENSLFDDLKVVDNINFFASLYNIPYNNLDLDIEMLNKKVFELSGGMKKRINILVSAINNPKYLILDEPTANLDLYHKEKIINMIMEYKNKEKSVIITSHNIDELKLADKLLILKNGKIVFYDTPSKLEKNNNFKEEYLKLII